MANHIKCEECGIRFSENTGREYVKDFGGKTLDVCEECATRILDAWEEVEALGNMMEEK